MGYIVFSQNPIGDRVSFITEHNERRSSLPYRKFLEFLFERYPIVNRKELLKCLDRFDAIHLDDHTGKFEVVEDIKTEASSFQDLMKLNRPKERKKDSYVNRSKRFVDKILNRKERKLF